MFTDGVGVTYSETDAPALANFTAERAVVFLEDGVEAGGGTFRSNEVAGVYLGATSI